MPIQQNFLNEFEQKMSKLAEVRRNIQQSIQFKQQFTNELKSRLGQINQRLQVLAGLINQLKTRATTLEAQITTNSSDILGKQQQIEDLQRQMNSETQLRGNTQQKISALENQVKTYQEQIRSLTDKSTALERELASRGDIQATHARAIQELTQKFELEKSQLVLQVNAANSKIAQLEQTLRQLQQNTNQNQGQVQTLQEQINQLKQENELLINKLMTAIQAINDATNDLRTLMDSVPNVQTKQEVDQILNQISSQVENSIQSLQNTSQGPINQLPIQPTSRGFFSGLGRLGMNLGRTGGPPGARGQAPQGPAVNTFDPALYGDNTNRISEDFSQFSPLLGQNINLPNRGSLQGVNPLASLGQGLTDDTPVQLYINDPNPMTLGELKNKIRARTNDVFGSRKYKTALEEINNVTNASEIPGILAKNGITYRNGQLRGGVKSKKHRKQKGGFTYKKNFKRISITSHSKYNRSSKSKRSSR